MQNIGYSSLCNQLYAKDLAIIPLPLAMVPTMRDNTWLSTIDSKEGLGIYGDTN